MSSSLYPEISYSTISTVGAKGGGDFYFIYTTLKLYLFYSFNAVLCLQYDFEVYIKQFMCI
jgi:hypothetical protein